MYYIPLGDWVSDIEAIIIHFDVDPQTVESFMSAIAMSRRLGNCERTNTEKGRN